MCFAGLSATLESYYARPRQGARDRFSMLELKSSIPKADDSLVTMPERSGSREHNQRRMMVVALVLLLVALGVVIYRDRDFWFPDTDDADDLGPVPATVTIQTQPMPAAANKTTAEESVGARASHKRHSQASDSSTPAAPENAPVMMASNARTVLPPLDVEVVAGDYHSKVPAGSNSVHVDLQPGSPPQKAAGAVGVDQTTANMTMNAAENLRISAEAAQVVSQPVRPGYPVLARQMKVQGSVILQALIGRDGLIQDLHVLTGPPILADAAEQAVRQWRFKPHYLNNQPVESETSITVNFTISTN